MAIYLGREKVNLTDGIITNNPLLFEGYMKKSLVHLSEEDMKGIIEIRPSAFYGFKFLESIHIPTTVEKIGIGSFAGCSSLREITCHAINPPYYYDHYGYFGKNVEVIYIPLGTLEAYSNAWGWQEYANKLIETEGV